MHRIYHSIAVEPSAFCTRGRVDLQSTCLEQRLLAAYLSSPSTPIAMICTSLNLGCRMSVSSAMDFPIRRGSRGAQVAGISASVHETRMTCGLRTGKEWHR